MNRKFVVALLLSLGISPAAHAGFIVTVNGSPITNTSGSNSVFAATIASGVFAGTVISGSLSPLTEPFGDLAKASADVDASGAGTLDIVITETNIQPPPLLPGFIISLSAQASVINVHPDWSVAETLYYDPTNSGLMADPVVGAELLFPFATDIAGPYSITTEFTITTSGAGETKPWVSATTVYVPEPASLALLGCGLIGIAGLQRRKAI